MILKEKLYLEPKGVNNLPLHFDANIEECMKSFDKKKGILVTEKDLDTFIIDFAEWCCAKNMGVNKFTLYEGELEKYKKEKGL